MTLQFYNSLTRNLEPFQSIRPGKAGLYSCGPTVYDYAHIGNFRAYVFSDLLHRTLRLFGYEVQLVMNITDVDDKTIRAARQRQIPLGEVTRPFEAAFHEDLAKLHILKAGTYPRATDHVPEMIRMIEKLREAGHVYESEGSLYFRIESFPDYGRLINLQREELRAGASKRVASDEYEKEQVSDFVLWKGWVPEDGAVAWDSPFGKGRPGWHIECSAMSTKYLGDHFDLHTGGMDNKFPHHENEIAQSECCTGKTFVNTWIHCSHLMVDGKKMSKSAGNFYTLRDLLGKGYSAEAIRHLLISTHYRNFLNFTLEGLAASGKAIAKINAFAQELTQAAQNGAEGPGAPLVDLAAAKEKRFRDSLADDLNASGAMGAVFEFMHEARERRDSWTKTAAKAALAFLETAQSVFACFDLAPAATAPEAAYPEAVAALLEARKAARASRQFSESDRLRDALAALGWVVKDTPKGQILERS
ncbi:MAG: cysteine--tRNA ligase [Spirochaetes bacterium]|nr:cysteine--tRNA ligase [Spirochaetota bacterium]